MKTPTLRHCLLPMLLALAACASQSEQTTTAAAQSEDAHHDDAAAHDFGDDGVDHERDSLWGEAARYQAKARS